MISFKPNLKIKCLAAAFAFGILGIALLQRSFAATGQIYLSPATASVEVGKNISFALRVTPSPNVVNIESTISFDATKLQFISIDASSSAFSVVLRNTVAGSTIKIDRAVGLGDPALTTDSLIANLTFKALTDSDTSPVNISAGHINGDGIDADAQVKGTVVSFTKTPTVTSPSPVQPPITNTGTGTATNTEQSTTTRPSTGSTSNNSSGSGIKPKTNNASDTTNSAANTVPSNDRPPIEEQTPAANNSYTIKVKILDSNNQPLKNQKVTLFSIPINSTTDGQGFATFTNVSPGDHHIEYIDKDQKKYSKAISVDSGAITVQNVAIVLDDYKQPSGKSVLVKSTIIVGVFAAVVGIVLVFRARGLLPKYHKQPISRPADVPFFLSPKTLFNIPISEMENRVKAAKPEPTGPIDQAQNTQTGQIIKPFNKL